MTENYFTALNAVGVSSKTQKKNGLTYLSWAWAWGEIKKRHPDATYTVYEDREGRFYHTDGKTCWVKTGVTVNGVEHIEYLPVMDFKNRSIPLESVTSFDVNKAIQRSLTKAVARHGLGLYIYAGEDLPEEMAAAMPKAACADCGCAIGNSKKRNGEPWSAQDIVDYSTARFGRALCPACQRKRSSSNSRRKSDSASRYWAAFS